MLYFHRNRVAKGHPVVAAFLSIVIGALVAGGALASRRLDASGGLERIVPFALGVFGALLAVGMLVLRAARGGFEAPAERGRRRTLRLVLAAVIVAIALALSVARQARSHTTSCIHRHHGTGCRDAATSGPHTMDSPRTTITAGGRTASRESSTPCARSAKFVPTATKAAATPGAYQRSLISAAVA